MRICFAIVLFVCTSMSCKAVQKNSNRAGQKTLSFLALGDSYTIGEKVKQNNTWPYQLAEQLQKPTIDSVKIIAETGWRTDELLKAVKTELSQAQEYDLVSLQIGVNNQYQNKPISVFKEEFRTLLKRAIGKSKHGKDGVFVLSIPDYGVTPFGQQKNPAKIHREIARYNALSREICGDMKVSFYNITPVSLQAENNSSLVASDGLHPSARMYALWVDKITKRVSEKISE